MKGLSSVTGGSVLTGKDRAKSLKQMRTAEATGGKLSSNSNSSSSCSSSGSSRGGVPSSFYEIDAPTIPVSSSSSAAQTLSISLTSHDPHGGVVATQGGGGKRHKGDMDVSASASAKKLKQSSSSLSSSISSSSSSFAIIASSGSVSGVSGSISSNLVPVGFFDDPAEDFRSRGLDPVRMLADQDKKEDNDLKALLQEIETSEQRGEADGDGGILAEDDIGINKRSGGASNIESSSSGGGSGMTAAEEEAMGEDLVQLAYLSRAARLSNQASALLLSTAANKSRSGGLLQGLGKDRYNGEEGGESSVTRLLGKIQEQTAIMSKISALHDEEEVEVGVSSLISSVFTNMKARIKSSKAKAKEGGAAQEDLDLDCY